MSIYKKFSAVLLMLILVMGCAYSFRASEIYEGDQISFAFFGGSGRAVITCDQVEVQDPQDPETEVLATITFSRSAHQGGKSSYDTVRAGGEEYSGDNVFTIPVRLNENTEISGRTVAMSEPHWVDYSIFVSIDGTQPETETEVDVEALKSKRGEKDASNGADEQPDEDKNGTADTKEDAVSLYTEEASEAPEIEGLTVVGKMPLEFAENFNVYYYEGGYKLIDIPDSGQYLIVPEGAETPESADYTVLKAPVENVYMAATSAMSLICAVDALDRITMTGTDASGWHIPEPIEALENGNMIYAGKYSEPNYELLVGQDCHLAIESTMISHSPEVQEMLEAIDIPVFVDRSSYEASGLGRTEWIKVYGALFDKEQEAFEKYAEQRGIVEEMENYAEEGKTVAIVSISQDGSCVIRRPDDYIPAMIADAGGSYVFEDYENLAGGGATVTISMEEFYSMAVDADFLVYNGTITGAMDGKSMLLDESELFADFKSFREDQIWQIDSSLYQSTDRVAQLIRDFHLMMTDGSEDEMTFLRKME